MEKEEKKPRGYYVEKGSFFVHAAVILLTIAIAARLLGTMNLWADTFSFTIQIALPVVCALLYILFILLLGRVALWTTILPVLGGAAFFILTATNAASQLHMIVCIALAFAAAFIYTATLAGMIGTKWLNVIVFALILAYQITFLAIPAFSNTVTPISFADGMTLLSSIGIILAMFFAALAIRRRKAPKETAELPKIKDPVVLAPEQNEKEETAEPSAAEEKETPVAETAETPAADEAEAAAPASEADTPLPADGEKEEA